MGRQDYMVKWLSVVSSQLRGFHYTQTGSLQQYAEIPYQKHAGDSYTKTFKVQTPLLTRKVKLKIRKVKLKK